MFFPLNLLLGESLFSSTALKSGMDEFNKLRNSVLQNKKKVDEWEKTAINIISNALFKFQSHYNNKHRQTLVLIEKNKGILNDKILDLDTNIEKYTNKIDILY